MDGFFSCSARLHPAILSKQTSSTAYGFIVYFTNQIRQNSQSVKDQLRTGWVCEVLYTDLYLAHFFIQHFFA